MGAAIAVTADNFDTEVLRSDVPVLVDFWAASCPPCRAIAPIIDKLAVDYAGRAKVVKLDVSEAAEIAMRYQITGIPTLLYFNAGQVVNAQTGLQSEEKIRQALDAFLG